MRREPNPSSGAGVGFFVAALLLALVPATSHAWGSKGHRIVAEIAQRHLDPAVAERLRDRLDGRRLPELATWPDDIRSIPAWSCAAPFHYITVPDGTEYFTYSNELPRDQRPEGDALRALVYFETVLSDSTATPDEKERALSFLVHIVGDLHEPLHNGRGCDRGGNQVGVNFFGDQTNLHSVWDEGLIETEQLSFTEFATFIDHLPIAEIAMLQTQSPMDWVEESRSRLDAIYTCDTSERGDRCTCFCGDCANDESVFGGCRTATCSPAQAGPINLKYGYKSKSMGTLKDQLVKGGVRLAGMLNWVLSETPAVHPGNDSYRAFADQIRNLKGWRAPIKQCMKASDRE